MSGTAEKTSKTTHIAPKQGDGACFFRKAEEPSFFKSNDKPSFFSAAPVQAKLSVSTPDDPHEKEADRMADHVMRMAEPAAPVNAPGNNEEVHRKEEDHEVHAKLEAPAITSIQCKQEGRGIYARLMPFVQRSQSEEFVSESSSDAEPSASHADTHVSLKSMPLCRSPGGQVSDRGPPATSSNFESTLTQSKGNGSALPGDTLDTMNSRFNTDFSNVRVHTGLTAESLSSSISAQAFTHGSDIYFNTGKYQPGSESGGHLLAHELTHTIQQGSVPQSAGSSTVSKKSIQRQASDRPVPTQLNNAVSKAKGEVGKVNANEAGPDGFRTGWPRLIEYFKTTLGSDKVVPEGQQGSQGSVSEGDIKKERKIDNALPPANPRPTGGPYSRDAMPSWCGIFAFWSLHKGGVPIHRWELGGKAAVDINAAYPKGYVPKAGDIAYRNEFSHYALVEKASGDTVTTINGNTSGENNLGAQIQVKDHPLKSWTAFFDPLMMMDGQLGTGEASADEKPKTLKELRQELFHVNRKEEQGEAEVSAEGGENTADTQVHAKPELSNWSVNPNGSVTQGGAPPVQAKEESHHDQEEQPEMEALHEPHQHEISRKHDDEHADGGADAESPGVQLKVDKKIQCSWLDSALSVIDSAVDYVGKGLEAGKRFLLGQARDFAMAMPGYKALRVVLGEDPITNEVVDRNGHNFIEAAFDIMPGGQMLHDKLQELGALTGAEAWVDSQINNFVSVVRGIESDVEQFWNKLSLADLAHPQAVFERIGNIIHNTIASVVDFAKNAATELLSMVKHYLLTQLVSFIKEQTPAYPLLCVIIGKDPVTEEKVDRNGTNILNALLELGGDEGREQRKQMQDTGSFQKVANYIDRGIRIFDGAYDQIKQGIAHIWDVVTIESLMHPIDTFNTIYETFAAPVRQVWDFVKEVGTAILKFIKEVLLVRISTWAKTVKGYFLVTVIIGEDPFTQANVPRNVENIIHGFMSLMDGGEEQFTQMKETGAIDRATQRINAAVEALNMTPESIIQLFTDLWKSMSLNDLIHPIDAFHRIIKQFGEPIGRLIAFVIEIIKIVLDIIMQVMNFPIDLIKNIIAKAMLAVDMIKKDPIGFLKNLLKAIKQGFVQFFNNILKHLLFGLTGWLMSELKDAGVPELKDTSLKGVISWVLVVLDVSMETIWKKLAEHPKIGPQKVAKIRSTIDKLEGIWTFIKDVQERGIAAIWDKIKEQLTNLWDTVLGSVKSWVMEQIVNKVTAKLLSMLDPTGIMAVINSAIALYKAIQSFLKYLREMLQVVNSFVEGVVEIASGNTQRAADFLENSLHQAMPVVIGFLANQVGLGGIGHQIGELIKDARKLVDEAITWLVNKAVELGSKLLEMGKNAVGAVMGWWKVDKDMTLPNGEKHTISIDGTEDAPKVIIKSDPTELLLLIEHRKALATTDPTKALTADQSNALGTATTKYGDLITFIKTNKAVAAAGGPAADALQKDRDAKVEEIKGLMITGDAMSQPGTLPNFVLDPPGGPSGGGFATRMHVTKLSNKGTPPGSDATAKGNPVWDALKLRKRAVGGTNTFYVRGHLLSQELFGRGEDWTNLTPLANTVNTQDHEVKVESKIKKAIGVNLVMDYTVVPTYNRNPNTGTITKLKTDPAWPVGGAAVNPTHPLVLKERIIEAEAQMPDTMECTVKQVNADGTPIQNPISEYNFSHTVRNDHVETEPDMYFVDGVSAVPPLNISQLKTKADAAVANVPPGTWDDFYKDPLNKGNINSLNDTDKALLRKIFKKKELFIAEKEKIKEIDENKGDQIQTWTTFQSKREAYHPDPIDAADIAILKADFLAKMVKVKASLFKEAKELLKAVTKPTDTWGEFRNVANLRARDEVLTDDDAQKFKTKEFNPWIKGLTAAPKPAAPTAPPPSGPPSP